MLIEHRRIDLDAHGRQRAAADVDLPDALDLRQLLRRIDDAASYICGLVVRVEVSDRIMIGASAGLTLR